MTPARHTFKPVTLNESTGAITAITSIACATCHTGGFALTVQGLNDEKDGFNAALEALKAALAAKGYYWAEANPYFFTAPYDSTYTETGSCTTNLAVRNWQTGGTFNYTWNGSNCTTAGSAGTAGTAGTGKDNMGAAFNLNLLIHDGGAFAHNSIYVKRLIYDSIDWIYNHSIDNDVEAAINAQSITTAQKTAAINYLLGSPGGPRP